jgi:cytochrome o ubiquinol oxidase subunit 1
VTAFFAVIMGFALIWHIWWMAVAGLAGIVSTALVHAWRVDGEIEIPVETLAALERARSNGRATV